MKWNFFTSHFVDCAFTKDASGRHLFLRNGPFSRPYVLPNAEVKEKLHKKLVWYNRMFFLIWMLLIVLVMRSSSDYFGCRGIHSFYLFLLILTGLYIVSCAISWLLLHNDLKSLPRAERRKVKNVFADFFQAPSRTLLALTMTLYWVLAFAMMVLLLVGAGSASIVILMLLFVIVAIGCGYALFLKE